MLYEAQTQQVEWKNENATQPRRVPIQVGSESYSSFSQPLMYHGQGKGTANDALMTSTQPPARVYEIPDYLGNASLRPSFACANGRNQATSLVPFEHDHHAAQISSDNWQNIHQSGRRQDQIQLGYLNDQNGHTSAPRTVGCQIPRNHHNGFPLLRPSALFDDWTDVQKKVRRVRLVF